MSEIDILELLVKSGFDVKFEKICDEVWVVVDREGSDKKFKLRPKELTGEMLPQIIVAFVTSGHNEEWQRIK